MDRVRRLIAIAVIIYTVLITGLSLWLGVSAFSASGKKRDAELTLKQTSGEKELMEMRLKEDNLRIAAQISGFQKERDAAKTELQNSLGRLERSLADNEAVKTSLETVRAELNKARTDKTNLEVRLQSNVEPLIQQARDEARVAYEKERLKLSRELSDVRDLFQKTQSERDNLSMELQKFKSENSSLGSMRASLEKKVDNYERQLRSETQDKNKLSSDLKDLRESHAAYVRDNSALQSANAKFQQQIKDAAKETESLKVMLANSKEQVARLSKEKDTVDIQLKLEKSEKSKYYDESRQYRELSDKLAKDFAAEKESARKLSGELNAAKTDSSKKISELAKDTEDLKSKNKVLSEDLRKVNLDKEENLIKWKASADKITLMEKEFARLEDGRKLLESKYEAKDKEFLKADADSQRLKRDLLKLERDYASISETVGAAKITESMIKEQLSNSQKLSRETEARYRAEKSRYEEQAASLSAQNNLLQDSLTKSKSDLSFLTNSLKAEQSEKHKYYEESKMQSAKNNELQRQIESLNLKLQAVGEDGQLLSERLKDMQLQVDSFRKENAGLKTQVFSLDALAVQLKAESEAQSKQSIEQEKTSSLKIAELSGLLKEKTAENEKNFEGKGKVEEAYAKLDKDYKVSQESLKSFGAELSALKKANAEFQEKIARAETLKGKADKDLAELSDALKKSLESERNLREQMANAQKTYAETEGRMKTQLSKNEEQIIGFGNNIKKLSAERESQDRQIKDLSEQLTLLSKENNSQKEQLAKTDKELKGKASEAVLLQESLISERAKAKDDKAKYDEVKLGLEGQIGNLKSEVATLTNAGKKTVQQVETQDKQIRDKDEQLLVFSRENREYKDRTASLEKQLSKLEGESRVKITELSDKLRSEISNHDDTSSRLRFSLDKIASLDKDVKRYDETNKSLVSKYELIAKDFRISESERQKALMDLKDATDRVGLLQKDSAYLTSSLKAAVGEKDKANEERVKSDNRLADLTRGSNALKDKNEQLLKDSVVFQDKIKAQEYEFNNALKKERDAYQIVFGELNSAREVVRSNQWQLTELQSKNVTLDKAVSSLQAQLKNQDSDMQATIKQERDLRNNYQVKLEDAESKVNNYMKVEMDLRQKNSTLEKELSAWKVSVDDKIAEAMKQKETDYINRLREANERVKMMEETLTKERANFYYNLASYATRSQLFEEALDYYAKSLIQNPKDAATYYNMGVLYDEHLDNPSKAIFSYSKYLELAPAEASDREKVKKWINSLEKRLSGSKGGLIKKD